MNIGIDITPIIYQRGVSRYTTNLVKTLATQSRYPVWLYGSSFRQRHTLEIFARQFEPKTKAIIQPYPPTLQEMMWRVGFNAVKRALPKIDVFHSWDSLQPPDQNLPLVSTIHDLAILKFPETAHPKIVKMHQASWKILKERQAHVIAVSRSTRKDIIELLEFEPSRVHLIYEALPQEVITTAQSVTDDQYEYFLKKLKLTKPFLFFVGTREPRKNLLKLIEAWKPLAKDFELIIAGESGWDETEKVKTKYPENLRFLGKVSDQELAVLYSEAAVFVYPSLYEGFGLPILEAFYHGTPVVTSHNSGMAEVGGTAAELVDPESATNIRQGIETILNESKKEQQQRLQKMILRQQLFSWEKTAQQTIEVYQKAMGSV